VTINFLRIRASSFQTLMGNNKWKPGEGCGTMPKGRERPCERGITTGAGVAGAEALNARELEDVANDGGCKKTSIING